MNNGQPIRRDSVCVVNTDGSLSNAELLEQMTEGVDDRDIRAKTRTKFHAAGIPSAALNRLFPDLDPLPEE
ncbi:MAG TPA: hypothetical protein VK700_02210 [Steroidobacteraceae bacterium]|nr:hypothetical protein [Steroidobacteraceae bacterium]